MSEELEKVQNERGNNYGKFNEHVNDVDFIIQVLELHAKKKGTEWPKGFRTAIFYIVSKLVRLCATPTHEDSALDLSSYADLWLKVIRESK